MTASLFLDLFLDSNTHINVLSPWLKGNCNCLSSGVIEFLTYVKYLIIFDRYIFIFILKFSWIYWSLSPISEGTGKFWGYGRF